jgi:hypothetical protein
MSGKRTIGVGCMLLAGTLHTEAGCGGDDGGRGAGPTTGPSSATLPATDGDGDGGSEGSAADTSSPATGEGSSAADDASPQTTSNGESDGGDTTTGEGVHYTLNDPLVDGTMGTAIGGTFGPEGWTTTDRSDRIVWELPRLVTGSVEFTVTGITIDLLPLADHEIFALYEGGWDIADPIGYNPEFRNNHYKSMIRVYGQPEVDRVGQQKLMWGLCPAGAPGYIVEGECACATWFFEEPFGGDGNWDGSPQRLRVEWDGSFARLLRNDALVVEIEYGSTGLQFAPQTLFASLGTSRPLEVDTAGMPVGATFSDVVIEGITGAEATCG